MRKSILGTTVMVAALAVAFSDGSMVKDINTTGVVRNVPKTEQAAAVPEFKVIEEEAVPLSNAPVKEDGAESSVPSEEEEPVKEEQSIQAAEEETIEKAEQTVEKEREEKEADNEKAKENAGEEKAAGYDRSAAKALVDEVNALRVKEALVLSKELDQVAEQRAASCRENLNHAGMETMGECIARGQSSQTEVVTAWKDSEYHNALMCDTGYTKAGAACLRYEDENGCQQTIWVMVLD